MKSNGHILIYCFEISEINHFDKKKSVKLLRIADGGTSLFVNFIRHCTKQKKSLNRKFNFECHDIIVIGKDMKYSRLAHAPDQVVVFRMASLSNSENHFISKTF